MILSDNYEKLTVVKLNDDGTSQVVAEITNDDVNPVISTNDYIVKLTPKSNSNNLTEVNVSGIVRDESKKVTEATATSVNIVLNLNSVEALPVIQTLEKQLIQRHKLMTAKGRASTDYRRQKG